MGYVVNEAAVMGQPMKECYSLLHGMKVAGDGCMRVTTGKTRNYVTTGNFIYKATFTFDIQLQI